jgi:hypothetical protein
MSQQLTTQAHTAKMAQFQREVAAYDAMWPELVKTHLGKFVAFYQGQLVDQDDDEHALLQRMFDRYGYDKPFLVQQVVITRYPIVDI